MPNSQTENLLLIPAVTVVGYACVYSFELAVAQLFGIPPELITVTLDVALRTISNIVIFALISALIASLFTAGFYWLLTLAGEDAPKPDGPDLSKLLFTILNFPVAFLAVSALRVLGPGVHWFPFLVLWAFGVWAAYGLARNIRYKVPEDLDFPDDVTKAYLSLPKVNVFMLARYVIGLMLRTFPKLRWFTFSVCCLLAVFASASLGFFQARSRTHFPVHDGRFALVGVYGERSVYKPVNDGWIDATTTFIGWPVPGEPEKLTWTRVQGLRRSTTDVENAVSGQ
ncbi:MAG: hypothetical protein KF774_21045 [Planctomyces sp.]|nr:hypothetical protein [Planctomyces sp.]